MKRPTAVSASINVMIVLCLFPIIFLLLVVGRHASAKQDDVLTVALFSVPILIGLADIIFLLVRMKWVYYYNLGLYSLITLVLLRYVVFGRYAKPTTILLSFGIISRIIVLALTALFVWLVVELIRSRKQIVEYLSRK